MNQDQWIVHKFGGTSVGSVKAIRQVLDILLQSKDAKIGVVVSAMSGVTDRLIKTALYASEQNKEYENQLEQLLIDHAKTALELLGTDAASSFNQNLTADLKDLKEILRGVWLARHLPETTLELVSGYGELWSSRILSIYWQQNQKTETIHWVDARKVLVVEPGETGPALQWPICQKNMDELCNLTHSNRFVITGFIASTPKGVPTTLKRNGSDFSASIFGKLLKAKEVVIWTDVDGVYSADPRKVPEAECLDEISYEEAIELAYFGAKVIHPHTMSPAVELQIPILIKNTFNPKAPGTYIHKVNKKSHRIAKGFTTVDQVSLLNVEGTGMIGVPGVAQRLFGALREVGVSVILISQASSEHSICFAVPMNQAETAKVALHKIFYSELQHGQIERIQEIAPCSILAMVGDNMVEKSGVASRFFSALATAGVSVRAIAQGSSERNISAVINQADSIKALRATHSAFFLSDYTISVGLIGPGVIGKTFLKQIAERQNILKSKFKLDVRIRTICNSKNMIQNAQQIDLNQWEQLLNDSKDKTNLNNFAQVVKADHIPHSVIIDCSSNDSVAELYPQWLKEGIHIITPNKKAGSGPIERFQNIRKNEEEYLKHFFYEATVGAGLPVISTLRDLLQTGDEIVSVEGILSGTLSFLFSEWSQGKKFSDLVLSAKQKGYTEPDPREDLNGLDVARKVVILAREAGFQLNLSDVQIQSLVPKEHESLPNGDSFLAKITDMDIIMQKRLDDAHAKGVVLRYTGFVDATGKAQVGLREFPTDHPFARVKGTDNIIVFQTKRYFHQPLIIQGPGAGPEVTAGGIFADLLRLARALGANA